MANVTMRDIGKQVGVSAVTVSKALAGKSGVSEEMRQRIVQVAEEMGYVNPNALQNQQTRKLDVGILVPDHFFSGDSFYFTFYRQLAQELSDAGHFALMELLTKENDAHLALPHLVRSRRVDALILLGQPSRAYVQMIVKQPLPVVFLDFFDEHAAADAVVGDNTYGTFRLTNHLIKNGHRDIGFVGNYRATSSIMDRYLGFFRAMLAQGLPIRQECIVSDRDDEGRDLPLALPEKLPTAFVCNCDVVARRLIDQLHAQGLRVPEDVSVVGFDDFTMGNNEPPALTTFQVDFRSMAQLAVKLVTDRCNGPQRPCGRVVVSGRPIYRDSERAIPVEE
ncbi:MAG: LacI family DNA-binding transcriptional regulator [Clostridiales bacterium]|nr:LacI family DNA-binding transcriptional regulator [Clostridiales bacterium]